MSWQKDMALIKDNLSFDQVVVFPCRVALCREQKNDILITSQVKGGCALKIEICSGFPDTTVMIQCPEVTDEIRKLEALLLGSRQALSCTKNYKTHLIDKQDVLYIESVDKQCFLYTTDEMYETNLKLYELEEMLDATGFFRNAKSQIINIAKIKSLCPDFGGRIEAEMENGEKVIISRQYAKSFKERIGLK